MELPLAGLMEWVNIDEDIDAGEVEEMKEVELMPFYFSHRSSCFSQTDFHYNRVSCVLEFERFPDVFDVNRARTKPLLKFKLENGKLAVKVENVICRHTKMKEANMPHNNSAVGDCTA